MELVGSPLRPARVLINSKECGPKNSEPAVDLNGSSGPPDRASSGRFRGIRVRHRRSRAVRGDVARRPRPMNPFCQSNHVVFLEPRVEESKARTSPGLELEPASSHPPALPLSADRRVQRRFHGDRFAHRHHRPLRQTFWINIACIGADKPCVALPEGPGHAADGEPSLPPDLGSRARHLRCPCTAIKMADWYAFKDPASFTTAPYTLAAPKQSRTPPRPTSTS